MPRDDYDIEEKAQSGDPVHKSEEVAIAIQHLEDAITDFVQPANHGLNLEVIKFTAGANGQAFGIMLIVTPEGSSVQLSKDFVRAFDEHLVRIEGDEEE